MKTIRRKVLAKNNNLLLIYLLGCCPLPFWKLWFSTVFHEKYFSQNLTCTINVKCTSQPSLICTVKLCSGDETEVGGPLATSEKKQKLQVSTMTLKYWRWFDSLSQGRGKTISAALSLMHNPSHKYVLMESKRESMWRQSEVGWTPKS